MRDTWYQMSHAEIRSWLFALRYVSKFWCSESSNSLLAKNHRKNILKIMIWDLNSIRYQWFGWQYNLVHILNLENKVWVRVLCCLMTSSLSKGIRCRVWSYSVSYLQITRSDIRPHKVGCQPSDCRWSFNLLCGYVLVNILYCIKGKAQHSCLW